MMHHYGFTYTAWPININALLGSFDLTNGEKNIEILTWVHG